MAETALLPPQAPAGIPADLAKPDMRYRLQIVAALSTFLLFLLIYLTMLAGAALLLAWTIWVPTARSAMGSESRGLYFLVLGIRIAVFAVSALFFAFLLKGLFPRGGDELDQYLEVKEDQQPELFQFIRLVCQEIRCSFPARIYLSHEVNASVVHRTSIVDLVAPPRLNLLLGLGLLNDLNLVEFKALLAHEFGHFSQRSLRLSGNVFIAHRVIWNMVYVRDRWDDWVIRGFDTPIVSAFVVPLYTIIDLMRMLLKRLFRVLSRTHVALRRQMEFNADLVAVTASGSDAPVHVLLKSDFLQTAMAQTSRDLALAAEQGLWTSDLFAHQNQACEYLRVAQRNPGLGRPPTLPADRSVTVEVFQPEWAGAADMWADHPSHYDREQNAKRRYWRSPSDDRSTWSLFREPTAVREEITKRFYRYHLNRELDPAGLNTNAVRAFVDEEHRAITFSPQYRGIYDDRWLELHDFSALLVGVGSGQAPGGLNVSIVSNVPVVLQEATAEQIQGPRPDVPTLSELYPPSLESWAVSHRRRLQESRFLSQICNTQSPRGKDFEFRGQRYPAADAQPILAKVQAELEQDRRALADFDRSVFGHGYHLAARSGKEPELCARYHFHLQLQNLLHALNREGVDLESVALFLTSREEVNEGELQWIIRVWRQARQGLANVLQQATALFPPALSNWKSGESLASVLPAVPSVPDLDPDQLDLDFSWGQRLLNELNAVFDRLNRIQRKSLAGILSFQERLFEKAGKASEAFELPQKG